MHKLVHKDAVVLEVDLNHSLADSDPFAMVTMLRDTFPNTTSYVACYSGYENAVVIQEN